MEPWRTTVTNLLSQAPCKAYSAQDVIDVIVSCTAAPPHMSNQHPVFATFKSADNLGQPVKFTDTMHCEVVLASLAKYSHDVSMEQIHDSLDLIQLLQVLLYLYDHMHINLMHCAEHRPKHHRCVKAKLSSLLGASGRHGRPDPPIQYQWP
jgi:hypothetical protein